MQKIMIIDDSKTIRTTAELFLSGDYEVCLVEDGFLALGEVINQNPDLIFVDVMMPNLDGYQFCQLIKEHEEYKNIPVIILSSKDGLIAKAKGKMVGANEYLTKPFRKEEIVGVVQKYLE